MVDFFIAGGWVMFMVLAIGIPMLITAVKFARNASPQGLSIIRALTFAIAFSAVSGVVTNLASVARHVPEDPELMKKPLENILWGFNESMGPAILGFSLLTITWILVAFGVRRMPAE